jgi:hypothetical protein
MTTAVRPVTGAMPLRAGRLAAARLQAGGAGVGALAAARPAATPAPGLLPRRNR